MTDTQPRLPLPDIAWRSCAGASVSLLALMRATAGKPGKPDWPQLQGRQVRFMPSGRAAIFWACPSLGLRPGDEILVPAYNCGTEIEPLIVFGLKPVFYQVGRDTVVDTGDVQERITQATRAIFITHYFGLEQPVLEDIKGICQANNLMLLEDCAHGLFSDGRNGPLGADSDASIYSLTKTLPVPDGGILTLRRAPMGGTAGLPAPPGTRIRPAMMPLIRSGVPRALDSLRLFGCKQRMKLFLAKPRLPERLPADYGIKEPKEYFPGGHQNQVISKLTRRLALRANAREISQRRRANFLRLLRGLKDLPNTQPLFAHLPDGACPPYFPLLVRQRQKWLFVLHRYGVEAFPFWRSRHPAVDWDAYPEARSLKQQVLGLPIHQQLTAQHMDSLAEMLAAAHGIIH